MQEISLTIEPNADDYFRVLWWYQRKTRLLLIVVSAMILLLGWLASNNVSGAKLIGIRVEFVIVSIVVPPVFLGISYFRVRRQAKKLEDISRQTTLTFYEGGIRSESLLSTTDVQWDSFHKIEENENSFVVFPQEKIFYPVPKRFILASRELENLRTMLKDNLGERAKVSH